jgi:hypothetical protein
LANFISIKTVSRLKLKIELKQEPYRLFIVNRENINKEDGLIYIEIKEFYLIYNKIKHFKTIQIDLILIRKYKIILRGL